MTETGRDFRDFLLDDDVYELAGGVIPELAERLGVKLGQEPNSRDLHRLVGALGEGKVLLDNEEVTAIDRTAATIMVDRSGVQRELSRSLWTPDIAATDENFDVIVMTGAVANGQDRTATLLTWGMDRTIYVAAGSRVMDTASEKTSYKVQRMRRAAHRYPTESQYAKRFVVPRLEESGHAVISSSYYTGRGDVLAARLFKKYPGLLDKRIAFARVANSGVQLAVQMRAAARAITPDFDADPSNPQVLIMTDNIQLAYIEKQEGDPARFQKATTALRQLAVTAKMLHEAAGGE